MVDHQFSHVFVKDGDETTIRKSPNCSAARHGIAEVLVGANEPLRARSSPQRQTTAIGSPLAVNHPVTSKANYRHGYVLLIIDAVAYKKHSASLQKVSGKGILLSVGAGVLMSLFYRFVASSMATSFEMPEAGKLTPYSAIFFFAIGVVISNFFFNYFIMKKPFDGAPLSFSDYSKGSFGVHLTGILGGVIWNIGMAMSIIASGKAGFAISYGLGQGATLIAALWGVFIWKEFKGASKSVNNLIFLMFMAYLAGLALLVYAGARINIISKYDRQKKSI